MPADAPGPATPVRAGERSRPGPAESPLPVIDFARIANPPPAPGLGARDLFDFAAPAAHAHSAAAAAEVRPRRTTAAAGHRAHADAAAAAEHQVHWRGRAPRA